MNDLLAQVRKFRSLELNPHYQRLFDAVIEELEVRASVQPSVMPKCAGCGNEIDPDCCGCGSPIASHTWQDGHAPVPMGCACGYVTTDSAKVKHD